MPSADKEAAADLELVRNQIALARLELDSVQSYKHNPTIYVELIGNALFSEFVLEYAPKPERMQHITKRIEKIPALLDQAKAQLVDSPEVWNRVAREENDGNVSLIDKTLRAGVPEDQKAAYDAAATKAIAALKSFSDFLKNDLSKKTSDWRLGKEKYAQKFKYVIANGKTPEELLAAAEADLKSTREAMAKLAAPQTVEQALARLDLPWLELGNSSDAKIGNDVVVAGAGGAQHSVAARIIAKRLAEQDISIESIVQRHPHRAHPARQRQWHPRRATPAAAAGAQRARPARRPGARTDPGRHGGQDPWGTPAALAVRPVRPRRAGCHHRAALA